MKILVVDDHPAVGEGTKAILETEKDLKVDYLSPPFDIDNLELQNFVEYDVILMDLNLGEINGMEISKKILGINDQVKIVLYTGYDVKDYFEEAIQMGIHGAISKTESKADILHYIKHVVNDEIVIPYDYLKALLKEPKRAYEESVGQQALNNREKAILLEVEKGLTNQEIADKLHLSKRSIEYSLTGIFNKLCVGSRTEAVLTAKSKGILD
ncbi:response regulator transcription factor [Metabacillus arenae]|uniref:Response regulator transcription factor n=1 Tax=Metabacillus arenae TaxID=2771434 RepID=A0A926NG12_9BACI|nr:response regulator transcription factor [Metabacillus arenae]MBD1380874.1 response regulator transcription factor [Metabacillus arenae]